MNTVYSSYKRNFIESVMFKYSCEKDDAAEAYHNAVIMAYYKLLLNNDISLSCCLETYIYKIANNLLIDSFRSRSKFEPFPENYADSGDDEYNEEIFDTYQLKLVMIKKMLKKLPRNDRKLMDYYYNKDYDFYTISVKMRKSGRYLRKRKSLIIKRMREDSRGSGNKK